ncbi:MAG TPA: histidine kinase [Streptosporangiaceae bacterium]|jgi:signal transduction histidine kinase
METRNLMTALVLMAACALAVWLRTGFGRPPKSPRGRAAEVGWCVGLLAIVLTIIGQEQPGFYQQYPAVFAVPVAVAALLVLQPRLAFGLVPAGLIFLSLAGLVAARDYGFWSYIPGHFLFLPLGQYSLQYYLVLPLAYGLLGLGGWLGWRVLDRQAPVIRLLLGPLSDPARPERLWGLLLLPVVIMASELLIPTDFLGAGTLGVVVSLVVFSGSFWFIRRHPELAGGLATGGLVVFGAAGLWIASAWSSWGGPLRTAANQYVLYGAVAISSRPLASVAIAQSLLFIGLGLWLAPRTIPQTRRLLGWASDPDLLSRVQRLTESRAVAVDTAAADLRRLERDLHDGAQARLVALGMNLRAIERLIPSSPDAALALVVEARQTSARALTELRELVRGVHPPVLADRGLADAIRALALDTPMKVETDIDLPGRLAAPVETACYFAVAEVLTNAVKHSGARDARIAVSHSDGLLRIMVTDFGMGGADPARGSGLAGVERRLASFDGIVAVSSPVGGPTMVVLEVPCASSLPKISSC